MPLDRSLLDRFHLEPRSERELRTIGAVDATDFSIWSTKLELACDEAKEVLVRTGVSEASQAGDCIVGVYTASGDLAAAGVGTLVHAATGQIPLKYIRKHLMHEPTVGVNEGDMFFFNDAMLGGIHYPDMFTAVPITWEGELVAWVVAGGHVAETGAVEPGGMIADARHRYDEGLKAPPVKVGENFTLKRDLVDLFNNMVRDPRLMEGESMARAAACMRIRDRVLDIVAAKGADFLVGLLRRCCEAAAEGSGRVVSALLDGTFRQAIFMDSAGSKEGLVRIMVTIRKEGDRLTIDLGGSSPELPSGDNCPTHVVRAIVSGALCMYLMPDLPVSSGVYQPIEFAELPTGLCVNPSTDAATSFGIRTASMATAAVHACLNRMMFATELRERVAVPFGTGGACFGGGGLNQYGRFVAGLVCIGTMNATGGGSRPTMDGVDSAGFYFAGRGDALDIEHSEIQLPNLYLFRMLGRDVAGYGRFRGGAPLSEAIAFHDTGGFFVAPMKSTGRIPLSLGQFGGYSSCSPGWLSMRNTHWQKELAEGNGDVPRTLQELWETQPAPGEYSHEGLTAGAFFEEGDAVAIIGEGGGGWGDVLERDPHAVMDDVHRGVFSAAAAENVFMVVFDPDTLKVDEAATEEARAQERRARLRRAKPYDAFVEEWSTLAPATEVLKFFGPWPGAGDVPALTPVG